MADTFRDRLEHIQLDQADKGGDGEEPAEQREIRTETGALAEGVVDAENIAEILSGFSPELQELAVKFLATIAKAKKAGALESVKEAFSALADKLDDSDKPEDNRFNAKKGARLIKEKAVELSPAKKKIALFIADKVETLTDFTYSEIAEKCKLGKKTAKDNISNVLGIVGSKLRLFKFVVKKEEEEDKIQLIMPKVTIEYNAKRPDTPAFVINQNDSRDQTVKANIEAVSDRFYNLLLLLNFAAKYNKWITNKEISQQTGKSTAYSINLIKDIKEVFQQIGLELLKERVSKTNYMLLVKQGEKLTEEMTAEVDKLKADHQKELEAKKKAAKANRAKKKAAPKPAKKKTAKKKAAPKKKKTRKAKKSTPKESKGTTDLLLKRR